MKAQKVSLVEERFMVVESQSVFQSFLKRVFDVVFSSVCIIMLLPLGLLVFVLVKLDSHGPAIFRQQRVGKDGKKFMIYKFRTLYVNSNPYAITPKSNHDPRITRLGKVLRLSNLDEIPQFFNVLKGEMSVVGPRPEMPFIVNEYTEFQKKRLSVKPGVTGPWQLYGDKQKAIHENIEYDIHYIENQSLIGDLKIILKTCWYVMKETAKVVFQPKNWWVVLLWITKELP